MKTILKSLTAEMTLVAFVVTQVFIPAPANAALPIPSEVTIYPSFELSVPSTLGTVDTLIQGSSRASESTPTLIHIQTAHGNYEAQKNIQQILHHLHNEYGISTLLIEGSAFKLRPDILRLYPDRMDVTMAIADELTKIARVKGPELFLLEALDAEAYGIESVDSYVRNGVAFKEVLLQREKTTNFLSDMDMQIERLTSPFLNKDLRSFIKRLEDYEEKRLPLEKWLTYLRIQAKTYLNYDLESPNFQFDWPMMVRIFKLREFEERLDLRRFSKERKEFLQAIKGITPADYEVIDNMLSSPMSRHQLANPGTQLLFERMAANLPKDFDYVKYPNVNRFIGHLILQSELKGELLMEEMIKLEDLISERLAKTEAEKKILSLLKDHRLLKKLFALELTPAEYEKITRRGTELLPEKVLNRFSELDNFGRVRGMQFKNTNEITKLFTSALDFYDTVKERDRDMILNAESKMKELGVKKAAVITGGFHSTPFKNYFASKDFNYALISPKISSVEGMEAYHESILHTAPNIFQSETRETQPAYMSPYSNQRILGADSRDLWESVTDFSVKTVKGHFDLQFGLSEFNQTTASRELGIEINRGRNSIGEAAVVVALNPVQNGPVTRSETYTIGLSPEKTFVRTTHYRPNFKKVESSVKSETRSQWDNYDMNNGAGFFNDADDFRRYLRRQGLLSADETRRLKLREEAEEEGFKRLKAQAKKDNTNRSETRNAEVNYREARELLVSIEQSHSTDYGEPERFTALDVKENLERIVGNPSAADAQTVIANAREFLNGAPSSETRTTEEDDYDGPGTNPWAQGLTSSEKRAAYGTRSVPTDHAPGDNYDSDGVNPMTEYLRELEQRKGSQETSSETRNQKSPTELMQDVADSYGADINRFGQKVLDAYRRGNAAERRGFESSLELIANSNVREQLAAQFKVIRENDSERNISTERSVDFLQGLIPEPHEATFAYEALRKDTEPLFISSETRSQFVVEMIELLPRDEQAMGGLDWEEVKSENTAANRETVTASIDEISEVLSQLLEAMDESSMSPEGKGKVQEAIQLLFEKQSYTLRKDLKLYPIHPLQVALSFLEEYGIEDSNFIVSAVLHDFMEDVPEYVENPDLMGEQFGSVVQENVASLTNKELAPAIEEWFGGYLAEKTGQELTGDKKNPLDAVKIQIVYQIGVIAKITTSFDTLLLKSADFNSNALKLGNLSSKPPLQSRLAAKYLALIKTFQREFARLASEEKGKGNSANQVLVEALGRNIEAYQEASIEVGEWAAAWEHAELLQTVMEAIDKDFGGLEGLLAHIAKLEDGQTSSETRVSEADLEIIRTVLANSLSNRGDELSTVLKRITESARVTRASIAASRYSNINDSSENNLRLQAIATESLGVYHLLLQIASKTSFFPAGSSALEAWTDVLVQLMYAMNVQLRNSQFQGAAIETVREFARAAREPMEVLIGIPQSELQSSKKKWIKSLVKAYREPEYHDGSSGTLHESLHQIAADAENFSESAKAAYEEFTKNVVLPLESRSETRAAASIEERVIAIVSEQLGVPEEEITRGSHFKNDFKADSLDTVELVMEFEDEFEIDLGEDADEWFSTVDDAIVLIEREMIKFSSETRYSVSDYPKLIDAQAASFISYAEFLTILEGDPVTEDEINVQLFSTIFGTQTFELTGRDFKIRVVIDEDPQHSQAQSKLDGFDSAPEMGWPFQSSGNDYNATVHLPESSSETRVGAGDLQAFVNQHDDMQANYPSQVLISVLEGDLSNPRVVRLDLIVRPDLNSTGENISDDARAYAEIIAEEFGLTIGEFNPKKQPLRGVGIPLIFPAASSETRVKENAILKLRVAEASIPEVSVATQAAIRGDLRSAREIVDEILARTDLAPQSNVAIALRQARAALPESRGPKSETRTIMQDINPTTVAAWTALGNDLKRMQEMHLKDALQNEARSRQFSATFNAGGTDLFLDFSKNRIDAPTFENLLGLAIQTGFLNARDLMFSGAKINETENRAVGHVALRMPSDGSFIVDGQNVVPEVHRVLEKAGRFTGEINSGQWLGYTGKRIKTIVNIGIGGSDLGPVMVSESLESYATGNVDVVFVSNVDGTDVTEKVIKNLDPETTLFIIASKTFTTQETMTNAQTAKDWFLKAAGDVEHVKKHFVAVSTAREKVEAFGIDPENMFEFWDWVGGRYSLWSAIGLSVATYIGFDNFKELLAGAHDMDNHFREAPLPQNIPVILALLEIWYTNFLKAQVHAVLPYDQYLHRMPAYLQQAFMESNGKGVGRNGQPIDYMTSPFIFGEAGTNGQHAFYQQFHQGPQLAPADFIGFSKTLNPVSDHHNKFMANFFAQTQALALGKGLEELLQEVGMSPSQIPHRVFRGNQPTNSILINELTPRSLGALIAMYEHQIFTAGAILNVFSYDQWGVELGKAKAGLLLPHLADNEPVTLSAVGDASTTQLMNRFFDHREGRAETRSDHGFEIGQITRALAHSLWERDLPGEHNAAKENIRTDLEGFLALLQSDEKIDWNEYDEIEVAFQSLRIDLQSLFDDGEIEDAEQVQQEFAEVGGLLILDGIMLVLDSTDVASEQPVEFTQQVKSFTIQTTLDNGDSSIAETIITQSPSGFSETQERRKVVYPVSERGQLQRIHTHIASVARTATSVDGLATILDRGLQIPGGPSIAARDITIFTPPTREVLGERSVELASEFEIKVNVQLINRGPGYPFQGLVQLQDIGTGAYRQALFNFEVTSRDDVESILDNLARYTQTQIEELINFYQEIGIWSPEEKSSDLGLVYRLLEDLALAEAPKDLEVSVDSFSWFRNPAFIQVAQTNATPVRDLTLTQIEQLVRNPRVEVVEREIPEGQSNVEQIQFRVRAGTRDYLIVTSDDAVGTNPEIFVQRGQPGFQIIFQPDENNQRVFTIVDEDIADLALVESALQERFRVTSETRQVEPLVLQSPVNLRFRNVFILGNDPEDPELSNVSFPNIEITLPILAQLIDLETTNPADLVNAFVEQGVPGVVTSLRQNPVVVERFNQETIEILANGIARNLFRALAPALPIRVLDPSGADLRESVVDFLFERGITTIAGLFSPENIPTLLELPEQDRAGLGSLLTLAGFDTSVTSAFPIVSIDSLRLTDSNLRFNLAARFGFDTFERILPDVRAGVNLFTLFDARIRSIGLPEINTVQRQDIVNAFVAFFAGLVPSVVTFENLGINLRGINPALTRAFEDLNIEVLADLNDPVRANELIATLESNANVNTVEVLTNLITRLSLIGVSIPELSIALASFLSDSTNQIPTVESVGVDTGEISREPLFDTTTGPFSPLAPITNANPNLNPVATNTPTNNVGLGDNGFTTPGAPNFGTDGAALDPATNDLFNNISANSNPNSNVTPEIDFPTTPTNRINPDVPGTGQVSIPGQQDVNFDLPTTPTIPTPPFVTTTGTNNPGIQIPDLTDADADQILSRIVTEAYLTVAQVHTAEIYGARVFVVGNAHAARFLGNLLGVDFVVIEKELGLDQVLSRIQQIAGTTGPVIVRPTKSQKDDVRGFFSRFHSADMGSLVDPVRLGALATSHPKVFLGVLEQIHIATQETEGVDTDVLRLMVDRMQSPTPQVFWQNLDRALQNRNLFTPEEYSDFVAPILAAAKTFTSITVVDQSNKEAVIKAINETVVTSEAIATVLSQFWSVEGAATYVIPDKAIKKNVEALPYIYIEILKAVTATRGIKVANKSELQALIEAALLKKSTILQLEIIDRNGQHYLLVGAAGDIIQTLLANRLIEYQA